MSPAGVPARTLDRGRLASLEPTPVPWTKGFRLVAGDRACICRVSAAAQDHVRRRCIWTEEPMSLPVPPVRSPTRYAPLLAGGRVMPVRKNYLTKVGSPLSARESSSPVALLQFGDCLVCASPRIQSRVRQRGYTRLRHTLAACGDSCATWHKDAFVRILRLRPAAPRICTLQPARALTEETNESGCGAIDER